MGGRVWFSELIRIGDIAQCGRHKFIIGRINQFADIV